MRSSLKNTLIALIQQQLTFSEENSGVGSYEYWGSNENDSHVQFEKARKDDLGKSQVFY